MKIKLVVLSLFACLSFSVVAAPSINDMQGCQALLDHVDTILVSAPDSYPDGDVIKVRKGLSLYNQYIQAEIVTPGLLKFNSGDKGKADAMQVQIDDYKKTVVNALQKRFKGNKLYADYAVSINDCAKQAVPAGDSLEALKTALFTMLELSKL